MYNHNKVKNTFYSYTRNEKMSSPIWQADWLLKVIAHSASDFMAHGCNEHQELFFKWKYYIRTLI